MKFCKLFRIDTNTKTSQKFEALPSRTRIHDSSTCVSLNTRLESNKEEEEEIVARKRRLTSSKLRQCKGPEANA